MNRKRARSWGLVAATGTALAGMVLALGVTGAAYADTLFSANFENNSISDWSKSGGTWSVVTDGSRAVEQSSTGTDRARLFAGQTSWSDYAVQARVKPVSFNGSDRVVALASRASGSTKMYRLALINAGRVELQAMNGSSITVIGSASLTVSTGTWYTLRIEASGGTLRGFVNGTQVASGTNTMNSAGRIALFTEYASARFDDVIAETLGSTPASPTPTTPSPTSSPTTSPTTSPTGEPTSPPAGGAVYAAPTGRDSASGTQSDPTTVTSAITRVTAGGTIYLRGGTYNLSQTVTIAPGNNGTSSARKNLYAYPGETPVLNFAAQTEDSANRGLALNGSFWHIYGLIVERAGDNGIFIGGSDNIVERTVTRFNRDSGLQLSRIASDTPNNQWPSNNLVLSAESHDNADSDGEDADGFASKLTSGPGNVFRYDVSHNNIDDGWDLYTKPDTGPIGAVTIEYSLSYNNGTLSNGGQAGNGDRNGLKLGGEDIAVNHVVQHNIVYQNGKHGITYNRNPGTMSISNNVSIGNAERNFNFEAGTSVLRNNTSCDSGSNDKIVGNADSSNQFWSGSNGSRCSSYTGALGWSFAADGHLVVTFGGRPVTL